MACRNGSRRENDEMDWEFIVWAANGLTIIAGVIAVFGVTSSWLSRARVGVDAFASSSDSATIHVSHLKGASPAMNLFMGFGALDEAGRARSGEGTGPWVPALLPGLGRSLTVYDPKTSFFSGGPHAEETRLELPMPLGLIVDITWQRPMRRWLRDRTVVLWSCEARANAEKPQILRGRKALKALSESGHLLPSRRFISLLGKRSARGKA